MPTSNEAEGGANSELRSRAEKRLEQMLEDKPAAAMSATETQELIQELRVHQVELEMQNEELRRTQTALEEALVRYRDLYDFAPVGYLTVSEEGRIREANLTAAHMLNVPRAALTAARFYRFVVKDDQNAFFAYRRAILERKEPQDCELRLVPDEGRIFYARLDGVPVTDENDEVTGMRIALGDISVRKEAESHWQIAGAILEAVNESIVILDPQRHIIRTNAAFAKLSGYGPNELLGSDLRDLAAEVDDQTAMDDAWRHLWAFGRWNGVLQFRRANGEAFPAELSFTAVQNEARKLSHVACLIVDITERRRTEEAMRQRAYYDAITGLPNRTLFAERLGEAEKEAQRHGALMGLLFIDLDEFKRINDERGHAAGDALLREVGSRLVGCVRRHDTVARMGGDEFSVILSDVPEGRSLAAVADKIIAALSLPAQIEGGQVRCTASIGIAVYPADAVDLDSLQRRADIAMYRAKSAGRHTYRFYDTSMSEEAEARTRTRSEIARALRNGEFQLQYQPICRANGGELAGVEALLRWNHPEWGLLLPEPFLAVAEESGQIKPLGKWVLGEVFRETAAWHQENGVPFVSVNISVQQINSSEAGVALLELFNECGFAPNRVAVEITESAPVESESAISCLKALKEKGIRLIMDDFGTGYSSLGSLRAVPFDIVKIDRSFIENIESDAAAAHLVNSVIYIAHGLGLEVIAEGVETETELAFLRECGCDYVQGFFIGLPMSAEMLSKLMPECR